MKPLKIKIISDRALLIWLIACGLASLILALVASVAAWFILGCWPFGTSQASASCLARIEPAFLKFLPMASGALIALIIASRTR